MLSEDSYITSLTCDPESIDLNGYTLYINGVAWDGAASAGTAIEAVINSSGGMGGPGGPGEMGGPGGPGGPGGQPPEKP